MVYELKVAKTGFLLGLKWNIIFAEYWLNSGVYGDLLLKWC